MTAQPPRVADALAQLVEAVDADRHERSHMQERLMQLRERNSLAFDQGFAAAIAMVEAGATIERLRAACPEAALLCDDTQPIAVPGFLDREDTDVQALVVADGDDFEGEF